MRPIDIEALDKLFEKDLLQCTKVRDNSKQKVEVFDQKYTKFLNLQQKLLFDFMKKE